MISRTGLSADTLALIEESMGVNPRSKPYVEGYAAEFARECDGITIEKPPQYEWGTAEFDAWLCGRDTARLTMRSLCVSDD